jgi:hypothetical protein
VKRTILTINFHIMPRLEGQKSSGAGLSLIVAVVLLAAIALEYMGYMDLIPNFGM